MVANLLDHKSLAWERRAFAFSNDGRKEWATVKLLRVIMHGKAIHVNAIVSLYFSIAGQRFAETRNFDTIVTWCNDVSLLSEAQKNRMQKWAKNTQPDTKRSIDQSRSRTDILDEPQLATLKLFCRLTQCSLKWLYGQPWIPTCNATILCEKLTFD